VPNGIRTTRIIARLALALSLGAGSGVAPAAAYEIVAVPDAGSVTGSVRFAGDPPRLDPVPVKKNQDFCGPSVPNEALVLGPSLGVKGSVVLIEGVKTGKKPEGELVLDNVRCLFVPHAAAVMAGTPVKVRTSDPVLHNAHGLLGGSTIFNRALSVKGRVVDITSRLRTPGVVKVLCDAHTHMTAWIVVHDSPYLAVTDGGGNFRIDGVPPGRYTVTLWHEGFAPKGRDKDGRPMYEERRLSREVTVPRGGSVAVEFELR
jgi:plastocyanin